MTQKSEAYEDPTHSAAVHGLTPRRIIVIAFFGVTMLMSIFSVGIIVHHQTESNYALAKKISIATGVVFFVHAATGIYVTVDLSNEVFSWVTLLVLVVSCASTLVFQMLMLYQVVQKLSVMQAPFWKPISIFSAVVIVAAKGLSFALVFYIAGINLNSVKAESNFISAFHTAIGFISKIANLVGNLVFDLFKVYAVSWYTIFIQRNVISHLKVDTIGDHDGVKSVIKWLNVLMTLCGMICVVTLVVAILGFENTASRCGGIAGVHGWALKLHSKLSSKSGSGKSGTQASSSFAKTAPYEDAPLLKGDTPTTIESVRRSTPLGPMKRNTSMVPSDL
ncbi:hypothetical protein HDU80_008233 [Chytriomyces hyalinus]|nr:hypothetical protein HDU80_008233 [Chytriomyces hyalinus]